MKFQSKDELKKYRIGIFVPMEISSMVDLKW